MLYCTVNHVHNASHQTLADMIFPGPVSIDFIHSEKQQGGFYLII